MAIYIYSVDRNTLASHKGRTVFGARVLIKDAVGTVGRDAAWGRAIQEARTAWGGPLEGSLLLVLLQEARGQPIAVPGSSVFELVAPPGGFKGIFTNADMVEGPNWRRIGTLVVRHGRVEVIGLKEEAAAWGAIGAAWSDSDHPLTACAETYRPSICQDTPAGRLAADLYDARAAFRGDSRRAYRYL